VLNINIHKPMQMTKANVPRISNYGDSHHYFHEKWGL